MSGVLPIALSRACRLNEYFMHRDKEYVGIMRLHKDISLQELKAEMQKFVGKITQLPPLRSRVKRALREREVKKFELIEKEGKDALFVAEVEAGTYIRKLCDDLGKQIGGAHMLELRRTKASIFNEKDSITLYQFDEAIEEFKKGNQVPLIKLLIPAEEAIKKALSSMQLKNSSEALLKQLLTGKPLMKIDVESIPEQSPFALFYNDKLLGIYKISQEKDIIARPEFVFN